MASKKESTFMNMVLTLLIITFVASAALGYLYELTKGPIEASKLDKKINAIKQVVPIFDNNPNDEMYQLEVADGEPLEIYPAKKGDELVGIAIKTYTNKGFSGLVRIMVGFTPDGTVYNYQVLEHQETPGLGSKMNDWFRPKEKSDVSEKEKFSIFNWLFGINPNQGGDKKSIINKNPGTVKFIVSKDGGDIDAITAATISSRAFLDAIARAYDIYFNNPDNNNSKEQTEELNAEGGKQ